MRFMVRLQERIDPAAARALRRLLFETPASPNGRENTGDKGCPNSEAGSDVEPLGREVRR